MTCYQAIADEVQVRARACGRPPVRVVAVSKTVGADAISAAAAEGARDFGENRPEPLAEKAVAFPELTWHFIGNIQSRKIPEIVQHADLIHSLSHHHHAEAIDRAASRLGKVQKVLIEVNVSGEASKSGVVPDAALELVTFTNALPAVAVCGLMTMAPRADAEAAQDAFTKLAALKETIASALDAEARESFTELSMGMSDDWEIAVAAGATIVRIGRAIFDDHYQKEQD